jgi:hypothetical protein
MQGPFLPVEDEQAIWLGPQVWAAPPATVLLSQFSSSTPGSQSCSPSHLQQSNEKKDKKNMILCRGRVQPL